MGNDAASGWIVSVSREINGDGKLENEADFLQSGEAEFPMFYLIIFRDFFEFCGETSEGQI